MGAARTVQIYMKWNKNIGYTMPIVEDLREGFDTSAHFSITLEAKM